MFNVNFRNIIYKIIIITIYRGKMMMMKYKRKSLVID